MQIEDNITQEYRAGAAKVPEPALPPNKPNTKPPNASVRKSKPVLNSDEMMELIMNRAVQHMKNEMNHWADQVAEVTHFYIYVFSMFEV